MPDHAQVHQWLPTHRWLPCGVTRLVSHFLTPCERKKQAIYCDCSALRQNCRSCATFHQPVFSCWCSAQTSPVFPTESYNVKGAHQTPCLLRGVLSPFATTAPLSHHPASQPVVREESCLVAAPSMDEPGSKCSHQEALSARSGIVASGVIFATIRLSALPRLVGSPHSSHVHATQLPNTLMVVFACNHPPASQRASAVVTEACVV